MNKQAIWKLYRKKLLVWLLAAAAMSTALYYGIDKKIVVFVTLLFGVFTQLFTGLGALIALIPLIGPLIIKVVTIPGFFLLNALGTVVSGIAIKKGYIKDPDSICDITKPEESMLNQPQLPRKELTGLAKTAGLYQMLPKSKWKFIKKAEGDDKEANELRAQLRKDYNWLRKT